MILALLIIFLIVLFVFHRNRLIKLSILIPVFASILVVSLGGYFYLSKTDQRFKTLNQILLGKRKLDDRTMNIISSGRWAIFKEAIEVIERDIKEKNILHILIGHGTRAKEYLHPESPIKQPRYESFFIITEFIERGLTGVIGILIIYTHYFSTILSFRLKREIDYYRLILIIPLGIHLVQTLFTYFWDAMLPMFMILFKISESSEER